MRARGAQIYRDDASASPRSTTLDVAKLGTVVQGWDVRVSDAGFAQVTRGNIYENSIGIPGKRADNSRMKQEKGDFTISRVYLLLCSPSTTRG